VQCPGTAAVGDSPGHDPHEVDEGHFYVAKGRRDRVCKTCRRIIQRRYERRYEQRVRESKSAHARSVRFSRYGITQERYDELVAAQDGRCCICDREAPLQVDHCHVTGDVRFLLCGNCNRGLGMFDDSIERLEAAIRYLQVSRS
jgi:hypothetical protein